MRIAVTSENKLKLRAVREAALICGYEDVSVKGYSSDSMVGEQPIGDQTKKGAENRIGSILATVGSESELPELIVSIENGIFFEEGEWHDKSVVVFLYLNEDSKPSLVSKFSESVVFPTEFVEEARSIGFDKITVGQVMADANHIRDPKDPHVDLCGRTREDIITSAVVLAFHEVGTTKDIESMGFSK